MLPVALNCKPYITTDEARKFLHQNWDFLQVTGFQEVISYEYRTYVVNAQSGNFVFKIANKNESQNDAFFDALAQLLGHLENNNIMAQRLVRSTVDEKYFLEYTSLEEQQPLKSFLLTYIEGDVVVDMEITPSLCTMLGQHLSNLNKCLDNIQPLPRLFNTSNSSFWSLDNVALIKACIPYIETPHQRQLLTTAVERFKLNVKPMLADLSKGFIHGDPNESNIVISKDQHVSFIDWQDIGYSYKVYDLAILIFSMILVNYKSSIPMTIEDIGHYCLNGYTLEDPQSLTDKDIQVLVNVVECRTAVSLCVGQYTYNFLNPGNEYLLTTAKHGWEILKDLQKNNGLYRMTWKKVFQQ